MLMHFNFSDENKVILNLEFAQASNTLARKRTVPGGKTVGCVEQHESSKDQHADTSNTLARNRPVPQGRTASSVHMEVFVAIRKCCGGKKNIVFRNHFFTIPMAFKETQQICLKPKQRAHTLHVQQFHTN